MSTESHDEEPPSIAPLLEAVMCAEIPGNHDGTADLEVRQEADAYLVELYEANPERFRPAFCRCLREVLTETNLSEALEALVPPKRQGHGTWADDTAFSRTIFRTGLKDLQVAMELLTDEDEAVRTAARHGVKALGVHVEEPMVLQQLLRSDNTAVRIWAIRQLQDVEGLEPGAIEVATAGARAR